MTAYWVGRTNYHAVFIKPVSLRMPMVIKYSQTASSPRSAQQAGTQAGVQQRKKESCLKLIERFC